MMRLRGIITRLKAGRGREDAGVFAAAICSRRQVVISTATKSLQEQLFRKTFRF